jgi:hypothetical protein
MFRGHYIVIVLPQQDNERPEFSEVCMYRWRSIAAIVAAFIFMLAAACGGGLSDAVAWADNVCRVLQPFGDAVRRVPNLDLPNVNATRESVAEYFGSVAEAAAQASSELDKAGKSPIAGGDQLVMKYKYLLSRGKDSFSSAKSRIDATVPADSQSLTVVFTSIATEFQANGQSVDINRELKANPDLENAAKQAPSCQKSPETTANGR